MEGFKIINYSKSWFSQNNNYLIISYKFGEMFRHIQSSSGQFREPYYRYIKQKSANYFTEVA
jgi:hypothetical protein